MATHKIPPSGFGDLDKALPASIDAERFILASILLDDTHFLAAAEDLTPGHFAVDKHQTIFRRMIELHSVPEKIDHTTLANHLLRTNELESVDGLGYLVSLQDGMPRLANIDSYIRMVVEKFNLREAARVGQSLMHRAIEGNEDAKSIISSTESRLADIYGESHKSGLKSALQIVEKFEGRMNGFLDASKRTKGTPTGFTKLDDMTGGFRPGELIILAARPSMGKAQPVNAPVKTDSGWARIGDLKVGDKLVSVDGKPSIVTGVFPQGKKEIFKVTFSDGRSTEACGEHLWIVENRKWRDPKVMSTMEISVMLTENQYRRRLSVPTISGCYGTEVNLPLRPWLLGYLLGNGGFKESGRVCVSVPDTETVTRLNFELSHYKCELRKIEDNLDNVDYRIINSDDGASEWRRNPINTAIENLGLYGARSHQKFIPHEYFEAPRHLRVELLRGLMDADGTAEKFAAVTFTSTSIALAADVQQLVRSLGGISSIRDREPWFTYKGEIRQGKTAYTIGVWLPNPSDIFWLRRKLDRAMSRKSSRRQRLSFVSIERSRISESVCIAVSHSSRAYVTDGYVVTHNTALALNIAWNFACIQFQPVAIFSLEMSDDSLLSRMVCAAARVDNQRFRSGHVTFAERQKLRDATVQLVEAPIYIDDTANITDIEIHGKLKRKEQAMGKQFGLVIVDYLQLMGGKDRSENRNQEVSKISRSMKILSKELGCPFLVLSQLSRGPETRQGDHRPQLADLRESGSIEQDGDLVGFIFREEVYKQDREDLRGLAELIIAKQRNGPIGKVDLVYQHGMTKFENRAPDYAVEPEG